MPNYLAPGVYIVEEPSGARPIEAVGTSTAAFVGVAPKADAPTDKALRINNWTQFQKEYCGADSASTHLAQAVYGFFLNGGTVCYIVNVGKDNPIVGDARERRGLDLLKEVDDVAIVAAPGYADPQSYEALLAHCENMKDRVAILDTPEKVANIDMLTQVATAKATRKPKGGEGEGAAAGPPESGGLRPRQSDRGYGAVYYPWITVSDVFNSKESIAVPPSGHIAGIYARTDGMRGVHKAPANEAIRGATEVVSRLTQEDQERLNPNGVNCIRFFQNEGIRVWGARTLAASASEWRYVNVRRLFNMIEQSIVRSTRWVVFEPNDYSLWKSIRRDVSAFLTLVWRQGALMGQTPDQAFFVKCDAETNPPEDIDAGRVNILIGIAPVKPAEFVIFRIGQGVAGAEVTTEGGANA
ncbi:MAG TPA: phage tail sheath subtilisin-like domain-containing protein [Blastocatellia bacterium]|nr:phage tail sheath subtilisin-like domain-containing protein [Blastocatellia bacterium]